MSSKSCRAGDVRLWIVPERTGTDSRHHDLTTDVLTSSSTSMPRAMSARKDVKGNLMPAILPEQPEAKSGDGAGETTQIGGARHRRRLVYLRTVVALAAIFGVGMVAYLVVDHPPRIEPDLPVPLWREIVGFALIGGGLVVEVVGGVRLLRSRRSLPTPRLDLGSLPRDDRRQLLRQVRGERPTVPAKIPELRQLALSIAAQRHFLLMWVGVTVTILAQPFLSGSQIRVLAYAGFAVSTALLLITGPFMLRDIRRAQRFLRQNPEPATQS